MRITIAILVFLPLMLAGTIPGVSAGTRNSSDALNPIETSAEFFNALPQEQGPLVVTASFELRDINFIDDEAETFDFTGLLVLTWHDPRQAFDPEIEGVKEKLYMGDYQFNEVYTGWWPQVVLVNESGMYDKNGVLLKISPDGTLKLIEKINATAKTDFNLRQYPFDKQQLDAVFEILGFDNNEVVLRTPSGEKTETLSADEGFRMPQWHLSGITASTEERKISTPAGDIARSTFVVSMELKRMSLFIVRLIILPMIIIVMLSWSVFWMDKASLGDRINLTFIGILTVVAYQMVIGEILPRISYFTLMNAFLNFSFLLMCATVIINLRVSFLDRMGKSAEGDQLDRRCRWAFPLTYVGLILLCIVWSNFLPPPH